MSWKKKLAEAGYTLDTAPTSVKKAIKAYSEIVETIAEGEEYMQSVSDEDREAAQAELDDLKNELQKAEQVIIKKIDTYEKNKDHYKKLGQIGSKNKKQSAGSSEPKNPVTEPIPTPTPTPVQTDDGDGKQKKKNSGGFLLLALAVGVITLGAVNIFGKRD